MSKRQACNGIPINTWLLNKLFSNIHISTVHFYDNVPCWDWQRVLLKGYGRLYYKGAEYYAHRFWYEVFVENIPKGLEADHLCRRPICCNPCHIEPVTPQQNMQRYAESVTHCPRNHPYSGTNLAYTVKGHKRCKKCHRQEARLRYHASPQYRGGVANILKTHCKQGHEYTPQNTYKTTGWRRCKICTLASNRQSRKRTDI